MKKDFNRKLRKFATAIENIDVEKIFLQTIKETEELALDLNRAQMTELGVDSENKSLGKYAPSTKRAKQKKGQPSNFINLLDEGKFQDRMFLDTRQRPVMVDSRDAKTPILKKRWPNVLGLIPQFADQYRDNVMQRVRVKLKKIVKDKKKILQ